MNRKENVDNSKKGFSIDNAASTLLTFGTIGVNFITFN